MGSWRPHLALLSTRCFGCRCGFCPTSGCFLWGAFFPIAAPAVRSSRFITLYGVHTAGAALGICAGSFLLPYAVGYRATAVIAAAVNLLSIHCLFSFVRPDDRPKAAATTTLLHARYPALAFGCGFLALLLEVLFIRFVAIAGDSSIYAFGATSLVVVTLITAASLVTPRLPSGWFRGHTALHAVLAFSRGRCDRRRGVLSPRHVRSAHRACRGARLLRSVGHRAAHCGSGLPVSVSHLPFLFRFAPVSDTGAPAPQAVSRLIAANGIGCALGALVASFGLLPHVGMVEPPRSLRWWASPR